MVKLALSRRLCGLLIGHKGQTVRDFINDSGATIRVQVCACVCVYGGGGQCFPSWAVDSLRL
jgi:hypothetical protein